MSEALEVQVFYEVAALLVHATAAGFVGTLLRQPLIVSFIAAGMLAGPSVFGIAQADDHVDLLAKLGVSLLLFLVGLKLDLALVRTIGSVALMTGLGQVVFTTVIGFAIALALGLDVVTSLYVAIALTFSSTIIIVKLLSDKREIDSLHGRIALGFLIVQDLVVVLAMIVLSAVGIGADQDAGLADIVLVLGYGLLMLAGVGLFARYLATPLVQWLSRTPELLVTFAIGWAALLAASGHYLGFGKELGGLLAGVSLASTPFREAIAARLASLRDFLLLFFFLALGASLDLSVLGASILPAVVLSLFVLIGNPVIVMVIMGAMGYSKRPSFLAGLTVAQISEFSLIFIAMGISLGHVGEEAMGLVTLVGLVTIAASTYMITWSHELYRLLEPLLGVFERRRRAPHETAWRRSGGDYGVVLFGLGRYGSGIAEELTRRGLRVLGVDFDPMAVRHARTRGVEALFGDATDPEFLRHLPLESTPQVVATVPGPGIGVALDDPRRSLLRSLASLGFTGRVAVTAHDEASAAALARAGADVVLLPFRDAAMEAARLVAERDEPAVATMEDPSRQKELA